MSQLMSATAFKARCLQLFDQVAKTRSVIVITKHGVPVAEITPLKSTRKLKLRGSVQYLEDIVGPLDEKWDAET